MSDTDKASEETHDSSPSCKNHSVSNQCQVDTTVDVDMPCVLEVQDVKLLQTLVPSNPNEDIDNFEGLMTTNAEINDSEQLLNANLQGLNETNGYTDDDYVGIWEEDVSDPLEMLMISKDNEHESDRDPKPKCGIVHRGHHDQGRRRFQGGKRSSNGKPNRSNYFRPRNSYQNYFSGGRRHRNDNFDFSANSSEIFYYQRSSKYNRGRRNDPWEDTDHQSVAPSDSASQIDQRSSVSLNSHDYSISQADLAQTLSEFENFSASLLTLIDKYDFDHREVKKTVKNNINTFELEDEIVYLKPKIKICKFHLQISGCSNGNECSDLHICQQFIANLCDSKNCLMGHFWKTNHNLEILKVHSIASLQIPTLNKLFLSLSKETQKTNNNLQICFDYNYGKCQKDNCNDLHLCLPFLAKLCSSQEKCKLHHNPLHKDVSSILVHNGISINESPKDILLSIIESPLIKQEINKFNASGGSSLTKVTNSNASSVGKTISYDQPSSSKGVGFSQSGELKAVDLVMRPKSTTWSFNFLGEVQKPEICYYSVENYCKYEEAGCMRLHCHLHFHWQVCETGKPWVNLRDFQVLAIEQAFCDPQADSVDVPPLDPLKLDPLIKPLLVTMQGKSLWKADFVKMQLILSKLDTHQSSKQSGRLSTALELRRLCTEYIPKQVPKACIFTWYFLDKNKKWVEYGKVDSTGDTNLICDINSSDIEKHYRERPNSPLSFTSSRFTYFIDTVHLVQLNLDTNVTRSVRRRPIHHLEKNKFNLKKLVGITNTT